MKKIFFISLTLLLPLAGLAQSITENAIAWTSSSYIDLYADSLFYESFIIETSAETITLNYDGRSKNFSITGATGTWVSIDADGEILYQVSYGSKSGTVKVERVAGVFSVTIDFSAYANGMKRKFNISSHQLN